jgi:hypothetical protein
LREPQMGSIVVDGPAGVDERPGNMRTRSKSIATRLARASVMAAVPVGNIEGTEHPSQSWSNGASDDFRLSISAEKSPSIYRYGSNDTFIDDKPGEPTLNRLLTTRRHRDSFRIARAVQQTTMAYSEVIHI